MHDVARGRREAVHDYFAAVDRGDRGTARAAVRADLEFRFSNAAPTAGPESVRLVGQRLRSITEGLVHDIRAVHLDESASHATVEVVMTYRRPGNDLHVPACVVLRFDDGGLISEYRIYVDVSALGVDTRTW